METRQGVVLEYKKPLIEVVDGEINVTETMKKKFFSLDEIRSIIETKERQNLSSRMCYYRKKLATESAEKALKTEKVEAAKAESVDSESSKTEITAK